MNDITIVESNGIKTLAKCIYYTSNGGYYLIFTKNEQDSNGYVILYISKIAREIIGQNEQNVPISSLIGISITDENEWNTVKQDISKIIEDKKNGTKLYNYIDSSILENIKIKDSKKFKLSAEILNHVFGMNYKIINNEVGDEIVDYKEKYFEQLDKNKELNQQITILQNKISAINDILNNKEVIDKE